MESDPPPSYREAVHQDGPDRAAPTPAEDSKPVVSADVVPCKPALNPATIVDSATIAAKKSRRAILLGVAAVVLGLAGFASAVAVGLTVATGVLGTTGTAPRNATLVVLTTYSGCSDLLTSLRASPGYNPSAYMQLSSRYKASGGGMPEAVAMAADSGGTARGSTAGGGADSYSTTNVQVQGIDESDLVKNDGTHIYSVGGSQLVIVRAYPPEAKAVLSHTELNPEGSTFEIFAAEEALLAGDALLVLSAAQVKEGGRRFAAVVAQTWNVSDTVAPTLRHQVILEGSLVTARLVGSLAYVAVSTAPRLPEGGGRFSEMAEVDVMPWVGGGGGGGLEPAALCADVSYVAEVQPRSLLVLASISLPSGVLKHRSVLATGSAYREASVLASASSLYVATYNSAWSCEEQQCDSWWCSGWGQGGCTFSSVTAIAAFDLKADGAMPLRATGRVPGYLLSQWAMDEHAGHLRVAYTSEDAGGRWRGGNTANGVDVLGTADLARVGRVDGLASGERIYAMRFVGDHGFMVTFRQVDPLFTLSLADPTAPRVLGELKIPGYSDYLHPVGEHALLGVGKAGDDSGRLRGVKLALFDISDLTSPRIVASVELGGPGSRCGVEDDHKALLYDAARQMLVVPVTERSQAWSCDAPPSFHGAKAYTLDTASAAFTLRAAIEHGPNRSAAGAWQQQRWACASEACAAGAVRRAVRIGEELFTISDNEVRATSLTDWRQTWRAPLHARQPLAAEGTCSLDGVLLPWDRVAASDANVYCNNWGGGADPVECTADTNLTRAECVTYSARRTFDNLLSGARAGCGACATEYDGCRLWF